MPLQYDSTMDMSTAYGRDSDSALTNMNVKDNDSIEFSLSDYYSTHGNGAGLETNFVPSMGSDVNMSDDISEYLSEQPDEVVELLEGGFPDNSIVDKIEFKLNELFSTNKFSGKISLSNRDDLEIAIKQAISYRNYKYEGLSKISKNRDDRFYKLGKMLVNNK